MMQCLVCPERDLTVTPAARAHAVDVAELLRETCESIAIPNTDRRQHDVSALETIIPVEFVRPGRVILVGGRPGAGKTSLAIQLATAFASRDFKALLFTAERSAYDTALCAISMLAGVDRGKLKKKEMSENDCIRLAGASDTFLPNAFTIYESASMSTAAMRAEILRLKSDCSSGSAHLLIVVDYLQLVRLTDADINEPKDVTMLSVLRELEHMAKDEHATVVVLSQMRRCTGKLIEAGGRYPSIDDFYCLRDIPKTIDTVLLLHRYFGAGRNERDPVDLLFARSQLSTPETLRLGFDPLYQKFYEL